MFPERLKCLISETLPITPPRPAATVILVRNGESGLQTYLLKRSGKSKFFPGSFVFPGGVLDEDDGDILFWKDRLDISMEDVARRFSGNGLSGADGLPYCVAAIRETFEEAGALIVSNFSTETYERVCELRPSKGLEKLWLKDLASSSGCTLSLTSLSRWSHWITPRLMKYHFDTRFFVAIMPEEQTCAPDRDETDEGLWISPGEALAANLDGTVTLTPPTIVTMHELLAYPDTASLKVNWETRSWGEARLPRMINSESGSLILEPWDTEYSPSEKDQDISVDESMILPSLEPFSRIWLNEGIWKPVRACKISGRNIQV
jgi:8-oxo-dGTP pyrophosphatase MutT (NUDIX family)